jgi:hypothetical protein
LWTVYEGRLVETRKVEIGFSSCVSSYCSDFKPLPLGRGS